MDMIMKSNELERIRQEMEETLDSKRYMHTIGVEYTAAALAMRYDEDIMKARIAGLLHDCAKCLPNAKKLAICEKYNLPVSESERKNQSLLHAKVGSYLAKEKFCIKDSDILNAILNHTTGRPGMSLLEKIIFVADYIEPGRNQAPRLQEIRRMAFVNLDQAMVQILEDTLAYLSEIGDEIDPMTGKTYEYYRF